ncbi:hypothetical protein B0H13DRAFT_1934805 [Mycena leptocephala]|nr:hypothetical protein B0H13DRAFT_1934805 [Mycena leptocephala]
MKQMAAFVGCYCFKTSAQFKRELNPREQLKLERHPDGRRLREDSDLLQVVCGIDQLPFCLTVAAGFLSSLSFLPCTKLGDSFSIDFAFICLSQEEFEMPLSGYPSAGSGLKALRIAWVLCGTFSAKKVAFWAL